MPTCVACHARSAGVDATGRCPSCSSRPSIGRYRLDRLLGEGGFAEVWQATDSSLHRGVALKLLRPGVASREIARRRFLREAKTLASLAHPNVVRVFDAGEDGGRLYLVMELVAGEPLTALLERRPRDPRALASALAGAAAGVHHAHEHGVIHRDLKPANILVDGKGIAKVADFGLAHLSGAESALTLSGSPVGTPLYMAPEQVAGHDGELKAAIDIYALGAILYEGLAGRPPHTAKTLPELYRRILEDDPVPPGRIHREIPPELEWVALKCLDRNPARRYPSAGALAEDLQRFVEGGRVQARPAGRTARFARLLSRRRNWLAAAAALGLLVAVLVALRWPARPAPVPPAPAAGPPAPPPERDRGLALLETGRQALDRALRERYRPSARPAEFREDIQSAASTLQEAVAVAPDLVPARLHLGLALESLGDRDAAEREWREALRRDPDFGLAHYRLGRLLLDRWFLGKAWFTMGGDRMIPAGLDAFAREAREEIERALSSKTTFDDPLLRDLADTALAVIAASEEEGLGLARRLAAVHEGRDGEEDFWFLAAMVRFRGGLGPEIDRALARRPHFALARYWKGFALLNAGSLEDAKAQYDHALAMEPGFVLARLNRGNLRSRMGDRVGAREDYEEAVRLDPGNALARHNLAAIRFEDGDLQGAMADYDEAIRLNPALPFSYLGRARIWVARKDHLKALADIDQSIAKDPEDYLGHSYRYQVLVTLGRGDEAAGAARKALALAPAQWSGRPALQRFLESRTGR